MRRCCLMSQRTPTGRLLLMPRYLESLVKATCSNPELLQAVSVRSLSCRGQAMRYSSLSDGTCCLALVSRGVRIGRVDFSADWRVIPARQYSEVDSRWLP